MPSRPMLWPDPSDPGRSADDLRQDPSMRSQWESKIPLEHLAALLARSRENSSVPDSALSRIAEQACLASSATAAAIALKDGDSFVCRASSGANAPPVGVQLSVDFGLTGLCIREKAPQHCDDAESDPRVDSAACHELHVRSFLVLPLLRADALVGILEAFSPDAHAFGPRDIETLRALAGRVLENLDRGVPLPAPAPLSTLPFAPAPSPEISSQDSPVPVAPPAELSWPGEEALAPVEDPPSPEPWPEVFGPPPAAETIEPKPEPAETPRDEYSLDESSPGPNPALPRHPVQESPPVPTPAEEPIVSTHLFRAAEPHPSYSRDWTTTALIGMVIILAVLLGWMIGRVGWLHRGAVGIHSVQSPHAAAAPTSVNPPRGASASPPVAARTPAVKPSAKPAAKPSAKPASRKPAPPSIPSAGGLVVYQGGKVIFQQSAPPIPSATAQQVLPSLSSPGGSQVVLPPEQAAGYVIRRVEPRYPDLARRQRIQGAVVFEVWIGNNGGVQKLHVLSGDPALVDAAANAVRQWRFRPYAPEGKPVEFTTRLTVNFVLQENP